jgi:Holliday junction resolvasome RuvABC ATP-dependent DNA helicase subunit
LKIGTDIIIGKARGTFAAAETAEVFCIADQPVGSGHVTTEGGGFGAVYRLDYDDQIAMQMIVKTASTLRKANGEEGVAEVARRAREHSRVALRLLRRVRIIRRCVLTV